MTQKTTLFVLSLLDNYLATLVYRALQRTQDSKGMSCSDDSSWKWIASVSFWLTILKAGKKAPYSSKSKPKARLFTSNAWWHSATVIVIFDEDQDKLLVQVRILYHIWLHLTPSVLWVQNLQESAAHHDRWAYLLVVSNPLPSTTEDYHTSINNPTQGKPSNIGNSNDCVSLTISAQAEGRRGYQIL
jgi:hypothetical protein